MALFKDILATTDGNLKVLPILHSTDAYGFREILKTKILKLRECDVFKEDFLYAYYGIPSYRKNCDIATKNTAFFPVCFILRYEYLPNIHRIHPFDTGAFHHFPEIKKEHFYDDMEMAHFELDADINQAIKVVQKFYDSNENYLKNEPTVNVNSFKESEYEARSYTSLISDTSNSKYDNRVSTIELIFNKEITLNKDIFFQVILPNNLLDDFKDILKDEYDINDPIPYFTIKSNPQDNFGAIYNEFMKFTLGKNLI